MTQLMFICIDNLESILCYDIFLDGARVAKCKHLIYSWLCFFLILLHAHYIDILYSQELFAQSILRSLEEIMF